MFLIAILIMLIGLNGVIFGQRVYFKKRRYGLLVILAGFILMFITATMPPESVNGNSNETTKLQVPQTKQNNTGQVLLQDNQQGQNQTVVSTVPDPQSNFVGYLEAYLPPEAKGHVVTSKRDNGHYLVMCDFDLKDSPVLKTDARQYARDFVFAAYASGMPVDAVTIAMRQPDGKLGLFVTVGAKPASTQPPETWKNKSIGPTIFINWVKQGTNLSQDPTLRMQASGPFAD